MATPVSQAALSDIMALMNQTEVETEDEPVEELETVEDEVDDDSVSEDDLADIEKELGEDPDEESDDEPDAEQEDDVIGEEYFEDTHVLVNGEKVKLGELTKGYMRQSDYSKKTQAVAKARKEAEAIAAQAEEKANNITKQRFEMVHMDVERKLQQFNQIDWTALARQSPNDYTALKAEHEQALRDAHTIQSEYLSIKQRQEAEHAKQVEETAKATMQTLLTEIPNFNKDLYGDMMTYAVNMGMDEDTANNIVDAPSLKLIYKAYMFDKRNNELKTNVKKQDKPSVKSKLKQKSVKTETKESTKVKDTKSLTEQLRNTKDKNERARLETELVMRQMK